MSQQRVTPERITHLEKNEIFVFGSNLAGAHGGGAAYIAYKKFGSAFLFFGNRIPVNGIIHKFFKFNHILSHGR